MLITPLAAVVDGSPIFRLRQSAPSRHDTFMRIAFVTKSASATITDLSLEIARMNRLGHQAALYDVDGLGKRFLDYPNVPRDMVDLLFQNGY